ncbi:MAG: SH3 domain-containing protein [Anaerolineales bacterium]|nr:SH3 domain-containing protein [Anaerolineales bacterium]
MSRHYFKYVGLSLFLFLLLTLVQAAPAADSAWQASYWNNRTLSGNPVLTRTETNLDHDWGDNAPDPAVQKDEFSARWTRTINVPAAATYRFTATMDDGLRVWVDGALVIDSWTDSQVHSLSADRSLTAGDHSLKVEYYEAGGKAVAKLTWAQVGGSAPPPIANWKGEYFNNMTLSGTPVLVRDDAAINFDWGVGSPAAQVPSEHFSVRWTRTVTLEGGRYQLLAQADDGIRVLINGQLAINEWHEAQGQFYEANVDLPAGSNTMQVEFYENVGGAKAMMSYQRTGSSSAGNWHGEYFNNRTLAGNAALVRDDAQLNFNWGNGSPATGINIDNFSARWTRSQNFAAGSYRFSATTDDGVRVWVNNQLLIDAWTDHPPQTFSGDITVTAANIPLKVEYYEATGGAQIQLSWTLLAAPPPAPSPTPGPATGTGVVVSAQLNIRCGPGLSYTILTTVPHGTVLNLAGYRSANSSWVMVTYNGGQAWVSGLPAYLNSAVAVATMPIWTGSYSCPGSSGGPSTGTPTAVVYNAYAVNVRQAPVVANNIVTAVTSGTVVQLLGRNSNSSWAKIRLANGTEGWMNAYFLNPSVSISSLPIVN